MLLSIALGSFKPTTAHCKTRRLDIVIELPDASRLPHICTFRQQKTSSQHHHEIIKALTSSVLDQKRRHKRGDEGGRGSEGLRGAGCGCGCGYWGHVAERTHTHTCTHTHAHTHMYTCTNYTNTYMCTCTHTHTMPSVTIKDTTPLRITCFARMAGCHMVSSGDSRRGAWRDDVACATRLGRH